MQDNNSRQLSQVCQDMVDAGITPTVGLLRAKAPFKVSVTQAIEAIKYFNATNTSNAKPKQKDSEESLASLSKKVHALESTVEKLEQQVQALIAAQTSQ